MADTTSTEKRGPGRPPKASTPAGSTVGRPPGAPASKGNPIGPGSPLAKAGESLSPGEARRSLFHAHVGLAKLIRSEADLQESDFDEAGDAFADVANHLLPQLRLVLRFIGPIVLIGSMVGIWGRLLGGTPWVQGLWERGRAARAERDARRQAQQVAAQEPRPTVAPPSPPIPASPSPGAVPGQAGAATNPDAPGEAPPPPPARALNTLKSHRRV